MTSVTKNGDDSRFKVYKHPGNVFADNSSWYTAIVSWLSLLNAT